MHRAAAEGTFLLRPFFFGVFVLFSFQLGRQYNHKRGLMIKDIKVGNILDRSNRADIIVGMNTTFADVFGIAKPFVDDIRKTRTVRLGSVISFNYDKTRNLHLLICHHIGKRGWTNADQYVRYGMDYLWKAGGDRKYSAVRIGAGRVGKRDGADQAAIHTAMGTSFLPVDLFILDEPAQIPAEATAKIIPFRMWDMVHGEAPIQQLAA
jgi:hypothetical protein